MTESLRLARAVSLAAAALIALSCWAGDSERRSADRPRSFGIVVHGGAGVRSSEVFERDPDLEKAYREKLKEALMAGLEILMDHGSSVDAVEVAIRVMEDSYLFNAGKGAVFTSAGTNEFDASIMDGKTLLAGGVGAVRHVKNPISLARLVMDQSPHVLLVGEAAAKFAREHDIKLMPDDYFFTQRRWDSLQRRLREKEPYEQKLPADRSPSSHTGDTSRDNGSLGTVGAVALDREGNLAAGTSTGGRTMKWPGRLGDSPIIGAATYADNATCAVSTTGMGEKLMIQLTAKEISALVEYRSMPLQDAADLVVKGKLVDIGGDGGAIALDRQCTVAMPYTENGMYRGYAFDNGEVAVKIYRE